MGAMKIGGRWTSVSDFAGGYSKKFSEAVIRGAERYLRKGAKAVFFEESPHLPEEGFIAVEDEAEEEDDGGHHWPELADFEDLLDKEYEKSAEERENRKVKLRRNQRMRIRRSLKET